MLISTYGLVFDPRSKAERGDRLADGSPFPAVRKAAAPTQGGWLRSLALWRGTTAKNRCASFTMRWLLKSSSSPASSTPQSPSAWRGSR